MTNGLHKFETKSKAKVKPYCFVGAKKRKRYTACKSRAEFRARWPTAQSSQSGRSQWLPLQCPQQQRKDTHAPWRALFVSMFSRLISSLKLTLNLIKFFMGLPAHATVYTETYTHTHTLPWKGASGHAPSSWAHTVTAAGVQVQLRC